MHRPTATGSSWTRPGPHTRGSGVLAALLVALGIPPGLLTHPVSPANHGTGDSHAEEPALPATPRVRVALHLEEPAQAEEAEDVAEERWIVTQDRGRLLLRGGPAAERLVLRR